MSAPEAGLGESGDVCKCGESEATHGWGDPPHMFHPQGEPDCGYRFPDGTHCRLSPETHDMPGMGHHARAADTEAGR